MVWRIIMILLSCAWAFGPAWAQDMENRPQITVFEDPGYQGRSLVIDGDAPDLSWVEFDDAISSIRVDGGQWEVCLEPDYAGTCQVVDRNLPDMSQWSFNDRISSIQPVHRPSIDRRVGVTLYSEPDYAGRSLSLIRETDDLARFDFDDQAASIEVHSGVWTLCEERGFTGRCLSVDRDSSDLRRLRLGGRLTALTPRLLTPDDPVVTARFQGGDGFQIGLGGNLEIGGGAAGVGAVFFGEPHVNRIPIAACADQNEQICGQETADLMCREAGLERAVHFAVRETAPRSAYRLHDRTPARTRRMLADVLCI